MTDNPSPSILSEKDIIKARLKLMAEIHDSGFIFVDRKELMKDMQRLAFRLKELEQ